MSKQITKEMQKRITEKFEMNSQTRKHQIEFVNDIIEKNIMSNVENVEYDDDNYIIPSSPFIIKFPDAIDTDYVWYILIRNYEFKKITEIFIRYDNFKYIGNIPDLNKNEKEKLKVLKCCYVCNKDANYATIKNITDEISNSRIFKDKYIFDKFTIRQPLEEKELYVLK
jgi:hypothetical protein